MGSYETNDKVTVHLPASTNKQLTNKLPCCIYTLLLMLLLNYMQYMYRDICLMEFPIEKY